MSDIQVTLGGFTFADFEIPDEISVPTRQATKTHMRVGGKKTVDAMGAFVDPISWSGRFRGPDAESRRDDINALVLAGKPVSLTWGSRAFTVLIQAFTPSHRGNNEIPYSITCEVISDDADPNTSHHAVDPNEMIGSDVSAAQSAASLVTGGKGALASAMASVQTAVGKVEDFARATRAQIASVLQPIAQAQGLVTSLIGAAETALGSVTAIGGVIPGLSGVNLSGSLLRQLTAMQDAANLYDVRSFLGRAQVNLGAIGNSGAHVIVAGGDLFKIAASTYGSPSEWATIANANGISDPVLTGLQEITIPPSALGSGGVLR